MNAIAWQLEESIEAAASASFAWEFCTDVGNWDDPPAQFELDGPFQEGARGVTKTPGQEAQHGHIREFTPGESYELEGKIREAALSFEWRSSQLGIAATISTAYEAAEGAG